MLFREREAIELKESVADDIKKEIIAFANCNGGRLYVGVRDDGAVAGLDDPDETSLQISNMVRDAIKPDVTMFLHYETLEENGRQIVAVDIQRGTERPYYIARKGLRPEGVYVRQGYSSVPATDTMIRRMIKETYGDRFEDMRCLNQELTFADAEKEFKLRDVEFGLRQMRSLKLTDHDGIYSNLALLLSDQCVHTIKVAVFQGADQSVFKDRREFTGSLMRQMNEAYGTGIRKMMKAYEDEEEKPVIEATKNAFKITLPNRNAKYERNFVPEVRETPVEKYSTIKIRGAGDDEYRVLELTRRQGEITRNDVEELLKVSVSTASRILRRMVKEHTLKQRGKARRTRYTLPK